MAIRRTIHKKNRAIADCECTARPLNTELKYSLWASIVFA